MVRHLIVLLAAASALAAPAHAADAGHGKRLFFQRCSACHSVDKGGGNGVGPNLFDVVGRKGASVPAFNYSSAMKSSGLTWSVEELETYLANPEKVVRAPI